jgi:hypothetical protein
MLALTVALTSCKKEDKDVAVDSVEITGITSTSLQVQQTLQLAVTVLPANATDQTVTWESTSISVASVSQAGLVTALSPGTTMIRVISNDDESKYDAFELTVTKIPHPVLGIIDFKTDSVWTITRDGVTQIWSDVVMVAFCKKDSYDGGSATDGFNADCRQNPGFGDLFSFPFVEQYKDVLCPAPWSFPTDEDFRTLDILLGGTGSGASFDNDPPGTPTLIGNYLTRWGATFGGRADANGQLASQLDNGRGSANYWSQSPNMNSDGTENLGMAHNMFVMMDNTPAPIMVPGSEGAGPGDCAVNWPGSWFVGTGCMTMGEIFARRTNPTGNNSRAAGYMIRCVR